MKLLARRYNAQGSKARESGDSLAAIQLFERAIRNAPSWSVAWYNLGLTHKYIGSWAESYRCNAQAMRLDPEDDAAIWNMGIAATALGNWPEARRAWGLCKIPIPAGDGPIELDFGFVPIQISSDHANEVVWARRIDPARAILVSIPFPESNYRYQDLLLHDGAAVGHRKHNGLDVPVFEALAVLRAATFGTFQVRIIARHRADIDALAGICAAHACGCDDWSAMRALCQLCSEGHAPEHEHPEPTIVGEHCFAIAAPSQAIARQIMADWIAADSGRIAGEMTALLAPA